MHLRKILRDLSDHKADFAYTLELMSPLNYPKTPRGNGVGHASIQLLIRPFLLHLLLNEETYQSQAHRESEQAPIHWLEIHTSDNVHGADTQAREKRQNVMMMQKSSVLHHRNGAGAVKARAHRHRLVKSKRLDASSLIPPPFARVGVSNTIPASTVTNRTRATT